jgi:membrane peptidoglycan carboxypeptidase
MSTNPLTQFVTQLVQQVNTALALKPGARVPELWVQTAEEEQAAVHRLVGDRYLLGRSSRASDIVVRNPVVSQLHLSLSRDPEHPRQFILKDEKSTNGIYIGRRRLKSLMLRHGDVLTLGPPELANGVRLQYHNPPPKWVRGLQYALYGVGGLTGLVTLGILVEWSKIPVYPLPSGVEGPVMVYSRDQTPLRQLPTRSHQELDRLRDFSPYLPDAVIASEDSRYYWHLGVDPLGILRAVIVNLQRQGIAQGASTVTQQLARSLYPDYVGRDNTAGRKIREAIVALKLETFYSKDELLRTYLNRVYLGVGSYGFEDAAQFYFDKSAADVNLVEATSLVAILPAPNAYNPVQDYDTAVQLRDRIIERMAQMGMISQDEANQARRSRIEVSPTAEETLSNTIAPYFYSYIFTELRERLGESLAREGNFIVETGLDIDKQDAAEAALTTAVEQSGGRVGFSQGAIVTLDSSTGTILALVGGLDFAASQFNRATSAQRQPGSTFKLFAYAAALDQGISAGKAYDCSPVTWQGQRYRGCERSSGAINMYRGMAQSENAVAIRVAQDVGLDGLIAMARRLGIQSELRASPGLVLGESETNVLEMTGAYGAIANNGQWNRPHAITRVLDSGDCVDPNDPQTCRVIYDASQDRTGQRQAISAPIAQTLTTFLQGVIQGGTGSRAAIGYGEAGKTGTTDNAVDLWFIGYVPGRNLTTGIWLGNDDNSPTRGSSSNAAQLWRDYMGKIVP